MPVQAAVAPDLAASVKAIFPKATRLGEPEQNPPVVPVYQLNELLGYAFQSTDLSDLPGFSGDPINLLIGIDTQGTFVGVHVLNHHEPIFMHGLGEGPMYNFIHQYVGRSVRDRIIVDSKRAATADESDSTGTVYFDGVTKATVSVLVINDIMLSAALKVARAKLEGFEQAVPSIVRQDVYETLDWSELTKRGWVQRWQLPVDEVEQGLGQALSIYPGIDLDEVEGDNGTPLFADLYYAYLNPPSIGQNLLGVEEFARLMASRKPGEHLILVASNGPFPYVEEDFRPGTVPTRIGMSQNELPVDIRNIDFLDGSGFQMGEGPYLEFAHIFRIKAQAGFDPALPMTMQMNLDLNRNHLMRDQASFSNSYQLPEQLFEKVEIIEVVPDPLWLRIWKDRWVDIAIMLAALGLLTWIFIRQHHITAQSKRFHRLRWGFLLFTLGFVGYWTQGQLSVVNIYTLLLAIRDGFDISVFLLDPIIFVLWTYIFISLFLWGRGLFCGWLCPFGVMQELTSAVARMLKIKQLKISDVTHQRAQKIKYVILIALVGCAFYSLSWAEKLAEVEPFKTAVTLAFVRSWPFVLYAVLLLGTGLFIHKFFCRYLCPLGAGLAVLGRFSVFKWLHRRKECGSPCQLCKVRCEINSIHRDGRIDYDECIQCLECIVIINDADQCAIERSQRKRAAKAAAKAREQGKAIPVTPVA